jgi:hypothetical protein
VSSSDYRREADRLLSLATNAHSEESRLDLVRLAQQYLALATSARGHDGAMQDAAAAARSGRSARLGVPTGPLRPL